MAKKQERYNTITEVFEAFPLWESEGKAYEFASALWETAKPIVQRISERDLSESELVEETGLALYRDGVFTKCLTDNLRRLVVRYHARGITTTNAVEAILLDDTYRKITPFYFFRYADICGFNKIKAFLVGRLSYLKPSHPRWPEKKFGALWCEERQNYIDTIKEIPLTQPQERLQKLSEHYADLESLYKNAESASDKERYHKCMMRTLAGIELMTRDPATKSLSLTQERRPQALPDPKSSDVIEIELQQSAGETVKK
ncbi:hypothetical protein F4212_12350 [Candidatus Poribacteria bacterium]|nr:hypothetical protein [Candidatus Poribacteria bacterium]